MEMKALTINSSATRTKLRDDGRNPTSWGRARGFCQSTITRIFADSYPYQEKLESEFQKVLYKLREEGYLVEALEASADNESAAA